MFQFPQLRDILMSFQRALKTRAQLTCIYKYIFIYYVAEDYYYVFEASYKFKFIWLIKSSQLGSCGLVREAGPYKIKLLIIVSSQYACHTRGENSLIYI